MQCNPPIYPGYFAFYALCPDPTRVECEVFVPELSWRCKMPREFIEDPLAPATQDTRRRALQELKVPLIVEKISDSERDLLVTAEGYNEEGHPPPAAGFDIQLQAFEPIIRSESDSDTESEED